jgi:hypothetical protein
MYHTSKRSLSKISASNKKFYKRAEVEKRNRSLELEKSIIDDSLNKENGVYQMFAI